MSHETITPPEVPPSPMPPAPGYSPRPRPPAGERRQRRRWPALVAAAAAGGILASVAAAVVTAQVRSEPPVTEQPAPAPAIAQAPQAPPAPAPLPTPQADRQICQIGWLATQQPTRAATQALAVLPSGMKVLDPAVRANPDWSAAVQRAGEQYRLASETLEAQIVAGATPILTEAANTAVKALRALGDSYTSFAPVSGNTQSIAVESADQMAVLCTRLAP